MNPVFGWSLAVLALAAGWQAYRWQGLLLAVSVIVFWLLLQFSRSLRVLRMTTGAPIGHVPSAVMLNAKLAKGWPMLKVLPITRSLGRRMSPADQPDPEVWAWADDGGAQVTVTFVKGRVTQWVLTRPEAADDTPASAA
jgi:hypothetical protein